MRTPRLLLTVLLVILPALPAPAADWDGPLLSLQEHWAQANYRTPKAGQAGAFEDVEKEADALVAAFPDRPEPLVWKAITLAAHAGATGGLGALGKCKEARALLEKAETIDASALDGSIYTTLGSLYYRVPGWPLGFGDDDKAEKYLKTALGMNPQGIDPNYFYGDFLAGKGRYDEALQHLSVALQAPPRDGRPIADAGRRAEIEALKASIVAKTGAKG